jgi:hypothetical protein
MPKTETVDKFFDAVTDAYDALLDAAKSANDRGYRVSRRLIDEIERGQKEAVDLTRRLAIAPRDVPGFFSSAVRNVTDAQGRALDLTRQLLDEVTDGGRESRDTVRKVIEANRQAGQAAIAATRESVTRAGSAVQSVRSRVSSNGTARAATASARKTRPAANTTA